MTPLSVGYVPAALPAAPIIFAAPAAPAAVAAAEVGEVIYVATATAAVSGGTASAGAGGAGLGAGLVTAGGGLSATGVGLIVGGTLILIGGGIALYYYTRPSPPQHTAQPHSHSPIAHPPVSAPSPRGNPVIQQLPPTPGLRFYLPPNQTLANTKPVVSCVVPLIFSPKKDQDLFDQGRRYSDEIDGLGGKLRRLETDLVNKKIDPVQRRAILDKTLKEELSKLKEQGIVPEGSTLPLESFLHPERWWDKLGRRISWR